MTQNTAILFVLLTGAVGAVLAIVAERRGRNPKSIVKFFFAFYAGVAACGLFISEQALMAGIVMMIALAGVLLGAKIKEKDAARKGLSPEPK